MQILQYTNLKSVSFTLSFSSALGQQQYSYENKISHTSLGSNQVD